MQAKCNVLCTTHEMMDCVHADCVAKIHLALKNCVKVLRTEKSEKTKSISIMVDGKYNTIYSLTNSNCLGHY